MVRDPYSSFAPEHSMIHRLFILLPLLYVMQPVAHSGERTGPPMTPNETEISSPEGLSERRWGILDALRRNDWEAFQENAGHEGIESNITRKQFDEAVSDFQYFSKRDFRAILEPMFQPKKHFPEFFFPSEKLPYLHGRILMSRQTGPKGMGNLWLVFDPRYLVLDDLHLYTYGTGKAGRFSMERRTGTPQIEDTREFGPAS